MAAKRSTKKPSLSRVEKALAFAEDKPAGKTKGKPAPAGHVRLTVNLPEDLHRRFKAAAAMEGTTMGALLERWIREYL